MPPKRVMPLILFRFHGAVLVLILLIISATNPSLRLLVPMIEVPVRRHRCVGGGLRLFYHASKARGRIDVKHCHDKQWQVVRVNVSYVTGKFPVPEAKSV